jgi:dTDP-glucose 4,6-dehydratase
VDYIWHFASPASPIDYLELPIQTLKVGALGTHNALGLAKAKGAACCSPPPRRSTATRWSIRSPSPTGATSTRSARAACYDEAKRFAEAITMAYHRYHGVETRIVRIFNTYGPRMRPKDGRVVPAFISRR